MDEIEKINLSEILLTYVEFMGNPSENNKSKVYDILSKIIVRQYLSLDDKIKLIAPIMNLLNTEEETDSIKNAMYLEMGKVLIGLISGYCINIKNDLDIGSLQLSVYDILYETGFVDWILDQGAQKDYERFEKMVDNSFNFVNLTNILNAFGNIDPDNIEEFNDVINSLKTEMTPERLDFIKNLLTKGTPEFNKLSETLAEEMVDSVMGEKPEKNKNSSLDLVNAIEKSKETFDKNEKIDKDSDDSK